MNTAACFALQSLESRTLLSYYSITDIGDLGGGTASPSHIKNLGQIICSSTDASGATQAFIWSPGLVSDCGPGPNMITIDIPGSNDVMANAINDNGDVIGTARFTDENFVSTYRAFRYSQGKVDFLSMQDGLNN